METIDGIWYTKIGIEKCENFVTVRKVGLARDAMLRRFWRSRLDNVTEDQMDVRCSGV